MNDFTLTADMPVLDNHEWKTALRRNPRLVNVRSVPLSMFDGAAERQAQRNHYQSLERLRQRGGLSPSEMIAVLTCCEYAAVGALSRETGHRILYAMIALHNRGMRIAERRARVDEAGTKGDPDADAPDCHRNKEMPPPLKT